jgi:soluble lytic murein transglycosylase
MKFFFRFIFIGLFSALLLTPASAAIPLDEDLKQEKKSERIKTLSRLNKKKDKSLEDYRLFYQGEVSRLNDDCAAAVPFYLELTQKYPHKVLRRKTRKRKKSIHPRSRFYEDSLLRLAETFECLEQRKEAIDQWKLNYKEFGKAEDKGLALFKMGSLLVLDGHKKEGAKHLRKFWLSYPENEYSDEARGMLKKLEVRSFSVDELLKRGKTLLKRKEYEKAFEAFKRLDHREADFWKAEALFKMREYSKARDLFAKFYKTKRYSSKKRVHIERVATSSARVGDTQRAINNLKVLLKHYPRWSVKNNVHQRLTFLYFDEGQFSKAVPHLKKLSHQRSKKRRAWAVDRLAWSYYRLSKIPEAMEEWKKLEKLGKNTKALYWQGRVLEDRAQWAEAEEKYRKVLSEEKLDYYTFLALQHLERNGTPAKLVPKKLKKKSTHAKKRKKKEKKRFACLALEKAKRLSGLALKDLAQEEFAFARKYCSSKEIYTLAVAKLADKNDYYPIPLLYAQPRMTSLKDKRTKWVYPKAYQKYVEKEAKKNGVDPYLVYSMMRQESFFDPKAVSWVGAKGVLQLMPFTAERLAKKAGMMKFGKKFDVESVEDPALNIKLAMIYIHDLQNEFDKENSYVLASYNAGEHRVRGWRKKRSELDVEQFVEEIPFNETRNHVKKILGYYYTYRLLYD